MGWLLNKYGSQEKPDKAWEQIKVKAKEDAEKAKRNPIKTAFVKSLPLINPETYQPITKTLGMESPKEYITRKYGTKPEGENWTPAFLRALGANIIGEAANIATTPATFAAPVVTKGIGGAVGSIPVKGTTLGEIASKVPLKEVFKKDVAERVRYQTALKELPQRVAASQQPYEAVKPQDPVNKIMKAIQEAKPVRAEQERLYTEARKQRAAEITKAGEIGGEKGYHAQLGKLKGELPKADFEGVRTKLNQSDIDNLFNRIEGNQTLLPFEKITAKNGLAKLLGDTGEVPTKGELSLLSESFPREFVDTILSKRAVFEKIKTGSEEVINIPRAIMASYDLSAPFRQGALLVGKPKQFIPALRDMFKFAFSEKSYDKFMDSLKVRPNYALMKESKLSFTDMGQQLGVREERFMSNLAEKFPLIGKGIRASNRAYTGFLNKLRADVFDDLISKAKSQGINVEGKVARNIADFVNNATGRGNLPKFLEGSAELLNGVFFSPRLIASRLNILNPVTYVKYDPFTRKEALKTLMTSGSVAMTILGLAKMAGAKVGDDPRSADFGKIRVGDTRYDILAGFGQYARFAVQFTLGQHISSTTGVLTRTGEGYKPLTRMQIAQRFIETKEAPVMSFFSNLMKGQSGFGEKFNLEKEVIQRFIPLVIQDMYDLYQERGSQGALMALPAIFGVGVQTYSPNAKEMVYSANSVIRHAQELMKRGDAEGGQELLLKNKDILAIGKALEPMQMHINKVEKHRKEINDNIKIPEHQKKIQNRIIDANLNRMNKQLEDEFKRLKRQADLMKMRQEGVKINTPKAGQVEGFLAGKRVEKKLRQSDFMRKYGK